jgi:hypothetical protein
MEDTIVSIKRKVLTAVTTAAMLAGVFGAAFVPSASAVLITADPVVLPKYTTLTEGALLQETSNGSKIFGLQSSAAQDNASADTASIIVDLFSAGAGGVGTTGYDFVTNDLQLKATSSSSKVKVAWAYENDGTSDNCGDVDTTGTFNTNNIQEGVASLTNDANDSDFRLCIAADTATSAGTSTINVYANNVLASTFTVVVVGPVASLTLSILDGYKYISEDNDLLDDWLKVVAKDSAGTVINGASNTVSDETITVDNYADNPEHAQTEAAVVFVANNFTSDSDGATAASMNRLDVSAGVCLDDSGTAANPENDGEAGTSFALAVQDDTDGDIVSNTVTITCTGDEQGAKVTAVAAEATTGGLTYTETGAGTDGDLSITATVTDAAGRPLGDGADTFDVFADFQATAGGYNDLEWESNEDEIAVGGEIEVGFLEPAGGTVAKKYTYTVDIQVVDQGPVTDGDCDTANTTDEAATGTSEADAILDDDTDCVSKSYTLTYTSVDADAFEVETTVFRNKARTTARIVVDFGEDNAMELVDFTVEFANGDVVTYSRKANANGVATFRLSRRNTTVTVLAEAFGGTTDLASEYLEIRYR